MGCCRLPPFHLRMKTLTWKSHVAMIKPAGILPPGPTDHNPHWSPSHPSQYLCMCRREAMLHTYWGVTFLLKHFRTHGIFASFFHAFHHGKLAHCIWQSNTNIWPWKFQPVHLLYLLFILIFKWNEYKGFKLLFRLKKGEFLKAKCSVIAEYKNL